MNTKHMFKGIDCENNHYSILKEAEFSNAIDLFNYISKGKNKYFLTFDLYALFEKLPFKNVGYEKSTLENNCYTYRGQVAKERIYKIKLRMNNQNFYFEDLQQKLGKISLEDLAKRAHLPASRKIILEAATNAINKIGVGGTIAAFAIGKYRNFIQEKLKEKTFQFFFNDLTVKDPHIKLFYNLLSINKCGGYIYLNAQPKQAIDNVFIYDYKSRYPAKANELNLPVGKPTYFANEEKREYLKFKNHAAFQLVTAKSRLKAGTLPLRITRTIERKTGAEIYDGLPHEMLLSDVEIEYLKNNSENIEIEYGPFWLFKTYNGLFNEFNEYLFKQKEEAKKDNNFMEAFIYKTMINSYLGKLGAKTSIFYNIENGYNLRNVAGYAYLLAASRIELQELANELIEKFGISSYLYSDTDCIHSTIAPEAFTTLTHCNFGEDIGKIALEQNVDRIVYIAPKNYHYLLNGEIVHKAAGNYSPEEKQKLHNLTERILKNEQ